MCNIYIGQGVNNLNIYKKFKTIQYEKKPDNK